LTLRELPFRHFERLNQDHGVELGMGCVKMGRWVIVVDELDFDIV